MKTNDPEKVHNYLEVVKYIFNKFIEQAVDESLGYCLNTNVDIDTGEITVNFFDYDLFKESFCSKLTTFCKDLDFSNPELT